MNPVDTLASVILTMLLMAMTFGCGILFGYLFEFISQGVCYLAYQCTWPYRYVMKKVGDYRLQQAIEETRKRDAKRRLRRYAEDALDHPRRVLPLNHITNPMIQ